VQGGERGRCVEKKKKKEIIFGERETQDRCRGKGGGQGAERIREQKQN